MIAGIGGTNYNPELAGTPSESTHSRRLRDADPSAAGAANQLNRTNGGLSPSLRHVHCRFRSGDNIAKAEQIGPRVVLVGSEWVAGAQVGCATNNRFGKISTCHSQSMQAVRTEPPTVKRGQQRILFKTACKRQVLEIVRASLEYSSWMMIILSVRKYAPIFMNLAGR